MVFEKFEKLFQSFIYYCKLLPLLSIPSCVDSIITFQIYWASPQSLNPLETEEAHLLVHIASLGRVLVSRYDYRG